MSNAYYPDAHTPAEWRAMATDCGRRAAESFDRCDTDGFLSQWAATSMAGVYRMAADLAEANGVAEFAWPFTRTADGWAPVAEWRWIENRYGSSVLLNPGDAGSFWRPSEASNPATRRRNDERKGVRWGVVTTAAFVVMVGGTAPYPAKKPVAGADRVVVADVHGPSYADE